MQLMTNQRGMQAICDGCSYLKAMRGKPPQPPWGTRINPWQESPGISQAKNNEIGTKIHYSNVPSAIQRTEANLNLNSSLKFLVQEKRFLFSNKLNSSRKYHFPPEPMKLRGRCTLNVFKNPQLTNPVSTNQLVYLFHFIFGYH